MDLITTNINLVQENIIQCKYGMNSDGQNFLMPKNCNFNSSTTIGNKMYVVLT